MTAELITDSKRIQEEIGLCVEDNTLQSGIFLEGPRDRLPILVKGRGGYTLVTRRIEIGNYVGPGRGAKPVRDRGVNLAVYDPYFTMSDVASEYLVYPSEGAAIVGELGIREAIAGRDMPYARYLRLSDEIDLQLRSHVDLGKHFFIYEVDRDDAARQFTYVDPRDIQLAMRMIRQRTHVSEADQAVLLETMNAPRKDPFSLLDPMLREAGVECVFADTQLSIHTLTAVPWEDIRAGEMYAYYRPGTTLLFSTAPQQRPFLRAVGEAEGFGALVENFDIGPVGVEEKSLPVGYVQEMGEARCVGVSKVLTLWRDRHAYQFLPYYIMNGIGNAYALEEAIRFAKDAVQAGASVTERDVDRRYETALRDFTALYRMDGFQLKKYFSGIQVGNRCPFAALSSDYPLTRDMNTLKIDCGAHLFKNGILLSGSDECRSWCLTRNTEEVYELLGKNMREIVIPQIRSGMEGREAYWTGVQALAQHETHLKEIGMLDADFSIRKDYKRNIGHTFSKAESVSVTLDRENRERFEPNLICCVEYHWPYKDQSLGVEDMLLVTSEGSINFVY